MFSMKKLSLKQISTLKVLAKIFITFLGLYLTYKNTNIKIFSSLLKKDFIPILIIGLFLSLLNILAFSIRLNLILGKNIKYLFNTFKIILMGSYFNIFLPSTIGGDMYKISQLKSNSYQETATNIILDRIYGLTTIIITSLFAIVFLYYKNISINKIALITIVTALIIIITLWILIIFSNKFQRFKIIKIFNRELNLTEIFKTLTHLKKQTKEKFFLILMFSFLIQIITSLIIINFLNFINIEMNIIMIFLYNSIASLLIMVPISISGIGVRDYVYKELYLFGTNTSSTLLLAPYTLLLSIMTSSIGGLIFLFNKKKPPK